MRLIAVLTGTLALIVLTPFASACGQTLLPDPDDIRGIDPPVLRTIVAPAYPEQARRDSIAGVVLVHALVGRDGNVRVAEVEVSLPGLDDEAINAVRRYQFEPAHRDGHECDAWVLVPVHFGDFLPSGNRPPEPRPAVNGETAFRFRADVSALQSDDADSAFDHVELCERIMTESLALDVIPPPADDAREAFASGDTSGLENTPQGHERARAQWVHAARLAPWWPEPYRRLAAACIADHDYPKAQSYARIVLAGRPGDDEAEATIRRANDERLRSLAARLRRGR